jgi:hypothetical protein
LLAALPAVPAAQVVTLGALQFYRYPNLLPAGQNSSESVYTLPTTMGTIVGVCMTAGPSSGFAGKCERVLATLRLTSGSVLPLSPTASYGNIVSAAFGTLDAVRLAAGSQLRRARNGRALARAATQLALAHGTAASALSHLNAGLASASNSALATALAQIAAAYRSLAHAAARGNARAYRSAKASVTRSEAALSAALDQLTKLGYRVS